MENKIEPKPIAEKEPKKKNGAARPKPKPKAERKSAGRAYEATEKLNSKQAEELGPQAAAIAGHILKHGPATAADVTKAGVVATESKKPGTIVAWYLGRLKKDGLLRFAKA